MDPHASLQLPNATDTPMSDAAGIVVTEMNTPMRVLDRASVSETTPTTPARAATMKENQFGVLIRYRCSRPLLNARSRGQGRHSRPPGHGLDPDEDDDTIPPREQPHLNT